MAIDSFCIVIGDFGIKSLGIIVNGPLFKRKKSYNYINLKKISRKRLANTKYCVL